MNILGELVSRNKTVGIRRHFIYKCLIWDHTPYWESMMQNDHYSEVIMSTMAFQITDISTVCSTVGQVQIKENKKKLCHWPLLGNPPVPGGFPSQRASNAENVSIWWHHRDIGCIISQRYIGENICKPSQYNTLQLLNFISHKRHLAADVCKWHNKHGSEQGSLEETLMAGF